MTNEEFKNLKEGDIIRHEIGGEGYMVANDLGRSKTIIRVLEASNPTEWVLVSNGGEDA